MVPEIPGIKGENVLTAREVLGGKKVLGKQVIVVGGGQVGLETADFLAEAGKEVKVLEMLSEVGIGISPKVKIFLMRRLSEENVQILVNRRVKEIFERGIHADHFGQEEELLGDTIVTATGFNPDRTLLKELDEIIPDLEEFYIAGDCLDLEMLSKPFMKGLGLEEASDIQVLDCCVN